MQLSYSTLKKIKDLSRAEMNVFLLLVRYQDQDGFVPAVYYGKFKREAGFRSKQTFYNVLRSLKRRGLISYAQNAKGDFDISVFNKGYTKQEKPDYINLNRPVFRTKAFLRMKAHEKWLLMDLMRSAMVNHGRRIIRVEEFYAKYAGLLEVTARTVRKYLGTLRNFFQIRIRDGKYVIRMAKKFMFNVCSTAYGALSQTDQRREYVGEALLRRFKMAKTKKDDWVDLGALMDQYRRTIQEKGRNLFQVFQTVLERQSEENLAFDIRTCHAMLKRELSRYDAVPDTYVLGKKARNNNLIKNFNNFERRTYDWDALEAKIFGY